MPDHAAKPRADVLVDHQEHVERGRDLFVCVRHHAGVAS
jgi:hypothetical protein